MVEGGHWSITSGADPGPVIGGSINFGEGIC